MFRVNPQFNGYDAARIGRALRPTGRARLSARSRHPIRRAHAHDARSSGSTSCSSMWAEGKRRTSATRSGHVRDDGLAGVLRDDGDPDRRGRGFTIRTRRRRRRSWCINETRGAQALSRARARSDTASAIRSKEPAQFEIVGVVRDTKYSSIRDAAPPTMYYCHRAGRDRRRWRSSPARRRIRTRSPSRVRAAMRQLDPTLPSAGLTTQADQLEGPFRAGATVRDGVLALRRARAAPRVHRPLRADVLQRRAAHERDRHPHGARRPAA